MISHTQADTTEQIWSEFGGRLHAFIARRIGSAADADDILQEVFLRIHRHASAIEQRERLASWLFQVTRNAITDYYRAPVRRELSAGSPSDLEGDADRGEGVLDERGEVDGETARELAHCLRPLVSRLPPHYREAITLVDLNGIPQKDAATQAGLSLPGMKSRVQRGRQALALLLQECCRLDIDAGGRVMDYEPRGSGCAPCGDGCGPDQNARA